MSTGGLGIMGNVAFHREPYRSGLTMQIDQFSFSQAGAPCIDAVLQQDASLAFQPDAQLQVLPAEGRDILHTSDLSATLPVAWLPRGNYSLQCRLEDLELPAGDYRLRLILFATIGGERQALTEKSLPIRTQAALSAAQPRQAPWALESLPGTVPWRDLAWNRGHEDWFFRHFDHAALVITDYLLKQHELLKGRILDVGCGDGITDLGIFHRLQPRQLVGIDPFKGYERLPRALVANHLPADLLDDPRLQFRDADANSIPYADDSFDVVISWGSLEHIAGGYDQALREIRRVLKRDGLLFVHPGLYYGALGNHLGEFFDDPFIHLKLSRAELREAVLSTEPKLMDRAGHDATPAEYWQWFTELNPIRVADFEQQIRDLGFEPWRVALRSSDLVEYTAELQKYSIQDLATAELYLAAWNRKP
jgi:SAM-dependent methyltransferase